MNLIIHIGYPKTGTTTFQSIVTTNFYKLRKSGVLYPKAGRQTNKFHDKTVGFSHKAIYTLLDEKSFLPFEKLNLKNFKKDLKAEILQYKPKTILLSAEYFSNVENIAAFIKIFDFLKVKNIKILVFLRNQVEWIESFYYQQLKTRFNFEDLTSSNYIKNIKRRLNYFDFLEKWSNVVGDKNILPVIYKHDLDIESIVKKIVDMQNLKMTPIKTNKNTRLTIDALGYLHKKYPKQTRIGPKYNILMRKLENYSKIFESDSTFSYFFSKTQIKSILKYTEKSNKKMFDKYFKDSPKGFGSFNIKRYKRYPGISDEKYEEIERFIKYTK